MDNRTIIQAIRTTASLLELHQENEFKVRGYQNAVFNLEKCHDDLSQLSLKELSGIKGVGKSIAENISEMQATGSFSLLNDLLENTPAGILELLNIKGLGAKKIRILWKELGIENKTQLVEAIDNDKLVSIKGFGKKTQENIKANLTYEEANKGKLLYSQAEAFCNEFLELVEKQLPDITISVTGDVRRKVEIITEIQFLVAKNHKAAILHLIDEMGIFEESSGSSMNNWRGKTKQSEVNVTFTFCLPEKFISMLFITTASPEHLAHEINGETLRKTAEKGVFENEKAIYEAAGLPFYIPELREGLFEFDLTEGDLGKIVTTKSLKGILHNHSTYSDGKNSILEMAEYCRDMGCEYIGINDHSKAAYFYANGMYEEQVRQQQIEIDVLNEKLAPFKIFKGIEVDILQDGSLDYDNETLSSFDFTVASVHSAMTMSREKATERIIRAIMNPFTTMIGHLTARLLLRRDGLPVDHEAVIEACDEYNVILELNANPRRLDLDWRWIRKAIDKGVMISINPDAHVKEGLHDIYYGVCAARKAALPVEMTFNALTATEVDDFFKQRKEKALSVIK